MKMLKSFALCILLFFTTLNPVISRAGYYSDYAASYFQNTQYYRALATKDALFQGDSTYYNYSIYSYLNSASTYAYYGYLYSNYEYLYMDARIECYYAQYYASIANSSAYNAQLYAYYNYVYGSYYYDYGYYAVTNNYDADYYGSWANYYNFHCA